MFYFYFSLQKYILHKSKNIKKYSELSCTFAAANCHITLFIFMRTGTVKFFNDTKGFGFIVDNSTKEEIFVHASGLQDNIREGDTVTFDTERNNKGINAVDVKIV